MEEPHGLSTVSFVIGSPRLAAGVQPGDTTCLMSERDHNHHATTHGSTAAPELRLAGTNVAATTAAEQAMLTLHQQTVLLIGILAQDDRMLRDRLDRTGRSDVVTSITGRSSIAQASHDVQAMLAELDELLAETAATVC